MEFHKMTVPCMKPVYQQAQTVEQTLEIRLTEDMPDIGTVVGCWGQVVIRSKHWNPEGAMINGGVTVWAMYHGEEGTQPQWVEGWIPFQCKAPFREPMPDGKINVVATLAGVDCRNTASRKLMVRAEVSLWIQCLVNQDVEVATLPEDRENLEFLKRDYPVELMVESGEKPFLLEEEVNLPSDLETMVCCRILPVVQEKKVMVDKMVFRGECLGRLVYMGTDGYLHSSDISLPFSQYTELDREYDPDSKSRMILAVTDLETEITQTGSLLLKAGIVGQYVICDQVIISVVEDAYAPGCEVTMEKEILPVPGILESIQQPVNVRQSMDVDTDRVVDAMVLAKQPQTAYEEDGAVSRWDVTVQMLCYDKEGNLFLSHQLWQQQQDIKPGQDHSGMYWYPTQLPQGMPGPNALVQGQMEQEAITLCSTGIGMVTAVEVTQCPKDVQRPSLILCRAGENGLWELAKRTGSTVKQIKNANHLDGEPEIGQLLLIPVS